jgi:hypothetical protein
MNIPGTKNKCGIIITSYESGKPVISHIFWGNNIDEAMGMAKAHLKTDFFFSSTMVGEMKWHGSMLDLDAKCTLMRCNDNKEEVMDILSDSSTSSLSSFIETLKKNQ